MKASGWQPDVGGEAEEEIGASQVAGREGRNLEGPRACLGAGGRV